MRIEHIAVWVKDLEAEKAFYTRYFGGLANGGYVNPQKGFSSYFISFEGGARLEFMHDKTVGAQAGVRLGYAHIAFTLENERAVDDLTRRLEESGVPVLSGPRRTGDGYYESCVPDPEGNRVEITCGKA